MLCKDIAIFLDDLNNRNKAYLFDILECMKNIDDDMEYFKIDIIKSITGALEYNESPEDLKKGVYLINEVCNYDTGSGDIYNYPEEVKKDILEYLKEYGKPFETDDTLHTIYNFYHDDIMLYEYVTGNDMGKNTDSDSEIYLHHNIELIKKSLYFFNYDKKDIISWDTYEFDTLVRCYMFENTLLLALSDFYSDDIMINM